MQFLDIKAVKKTFDRSVMEDIKEFGKPALIYNYHHTSKNLNALDTQDMWDIEKANLTKIGWTFRKEDREIEINKKKWKANLWVAQPIKNEQVDEKALRRATNLLNDPLALAIGYMVSGLCYIELLNS